jgi:hypothetical protein
MLAHSMEVCLHHSFPDNKMRIHHWQDEQKLEAFIINKSFIVGQ